MQYWTSLCLIAACLWGVVGLLQKLATNRMSAGSVLVWVTLGFAATAPLFVLMGDSTPMSAADIALGVLSGAANALGSWFLFASLESGAKASVAVPLTALYPLVTVVIAVALLGETVSGAQTLGVALALAAGVLLSYEPPSTADEAEAEGRGSAVRRSS